MPVYNYLARDKKGQAVRGEVDIKNDSELVRYLEQNNLLLIKYEKAKMPVKSLKMPSLRIGRRISKRDIIIFTRQFATTVRAGIPIVNALRFLAEETQNRAFKAVLTQIVIKVEQGASLSQALREYPRIFSELYVEMVASGEISGTLDKILLNLAETMERDYRLYLEVKNSLRYPIIVFSAIVFAIVFISIFVVPRFARVYEQFKIALPLPTRILIGTSNFLIHNIIFLIFLVILLSFLFVRWKNTSGGKVIWGRLKLKIPLLGDIFMKVSLLRFCFIFNALSRAGVPIIKSLEIVSRTLGNDFLRQKAERFTLEVSEGKTLSSSIAQDKYFPKLLANMIGVGEQTGAMGIVISALTEYYHTEVKSKIETLTVSIEPLLTGLLAVCVLILALGVFLPMWNMTQLFRVRR